MWTLVFIAFVGGELESTVKGTYMSMTECFYERQKLSIDVGGKDGYFPTGSQAICVYRGSNSV